MVQIREKTVFDAHGVVNFETWLDSLLPTQQNRGKELLQKTYAYCVKTALDNKQMRALEQGVHMAEILAELELDPDTLAAALLFPTAQTFPFAKEILQPHANAAILMLIDGVKEMQAIQSLRRQQAMHTEQLDKLRRMLLAMVDDVRVVLIKLAERLEVLRNIRDFNSPDSRLLAEQAHGIYAPLANRLGIGQLKWELEDLSFRVLHQDAYKSIAGFLDERRLDREKYITDIMAQLEQALHSDDINGVVTGRVKHIYSIWRKMQKKHLDYHQIYDVRALRVIVNEVKDCYAALGTVHRIWQPIPSEFDDYIATPKANGYRSLHTAVIGPFGKTIEVQIRTQKMHDESEMGIASHWRYKEGVKHDAGFEEKLAWLRHVLDWQAEIADSDELLEAFRANVAETRVYVVTPKGDVLELAQGATPLDFAYHVHTLIGHRCRGAKVNGNIVPLTHELKTGDQVEILTTKEVRPSRDWLSSDLKYLKTPRARQKVLAWFREQNRDQNIAEGRDLIEKELHRLGVKHIEYAKIAEKLNLKEGDDVLAAVGRGDLRVSQILTAADISIRALASDQLVLKTPLQAGKKGADIRVEGVDNLMVQTARCCHPVPGDPIIGYITQGRGVSVHRQDCRHLKKSNADYLERIIPVAWQTETHQRYPVAVFLEAQDRSNLLRDVTQILSHEKVDMSAIDSRLIPRIHQVSMTMLIHVANLTILRRVLDRLSQVPGVIAVNRSEAKQTDF